MEPFCGLTLPYRCIGIIAPNWLLNDIDTGDFIRKLNPPSVKVQALPVPKM